MLPAQIYWRLLYNYTKLINQDILYVAFSTSLCVTVKEKKYSR